MHGCIETLRAGSRSPLNPAFLRKLGLDKTLVDALAELPGTRGNMRILRRRALALADLQVSTQFPNI